MNNYKANRSLSHSFFEHIDSKNRHIGIIFTIIGWFLIALSSIVFSKTRSTHSLVETCFHHYLAAFMLISLWIGLKKRENLYCRNPFLIILNSLICMICYYACFSLRVAPASIQNSYFLNADSLILAFILVVVFKRKIPFLSWVGLLLGFLGVMSFFSFKIDFSSWFAFSDALICLLSAFALAVVVLFTQYLLAHNPPIIIALSHTLLGWVSSGVFLFFRGWEPVSQHDFLYMGMEGIMYGLALYFFIKSLLYTESYIIMAMSYLLPVYIIVMDWLLQQAGLNLEILVGILLILVGIVFVPIPMYVQDHKKGNPLLTDLTT